MNELKKVICCPICKNKLTMVCDRNLELLNCSGEACKAIYPIVAGIPVLLPHIHKKQYRDQVEKQESSELRVAFKGLLDENKKCKKNFKILKKFSIFKYQKDLKVLDLGSGLGHSLKHLAGHFPDCYGVELDLERIVLSHQPDRVVCADMTYMPFPDDFLDIVLCIGVIHHLSSVEIYLALIREIKRVLKKNSLCLFWEPKPTFYRGTAEKFIFSPLGSFFNYTRMVRIIIKEEAQEYYYWLSHYNDFFSILRNNGFIVESKKRGLFKDYWVMRLA